MGFAIAMIPNPPPRQVWSGRTVSGVVFVLFALCISSPSFASGPEMGIPEYIEADTMPSYVWISASAAIGEDGQLKTEYFVSSSRLAQRLEQTTKMASTLDFPLFVEGEDQVQCTSFMLSSFDTRTGLGDDQFLDASKYVFTGRVADASQGFSIGTVGTLLSIEVTENFVDKDDRPLSDHVFVFFPYARFALGNERFCRGHFSGAVVPKIGDTVAVFAAGNFAASAKPVLWVTEREVGYLDNSSTPNIWRPGLCQVSTETRPGTQMRNPLCDIQCNSEKDLSELIGGLLENLKPTTENPE